MTPKCARRVVRAVQLMPTASEVGRGQWVQLEDGQWVHAEHVGHDLLDVDRQGQAGEECQVDEDEDHIA